MQKVQRLINTFKPSHYDLSLNLMRVERKFDGIVKITGHTVNESEKITLHSKKLTINSILVDNNPTSFSFGDNDALIVDFQSNSNNHEIIINFSGEITDQMHGLYPCYYELDGAKKELLATQFESHHAREVFPCIDEPEAKASFDLTLTTENDVTVLSNMPVNQQNRSDATTETRFQTSPVMSTYLLAWVVGDLHKRTAHTKSGVEVNVWSTVVHPVEDLDFALDIAVRSTDYFDEYFDTAYPLPKCDHVALPDFSSGAMENWGLITYRETLLISNPKTTSISSRHRIALVIAHELSHQWFGNLVTMKWWNDLWLNESFATLVEYMAIDNLEPSWDIWLDFASSESIMSLRRDRINGVQPVQVDVNHPDEIGTLFDGAIVYAKGARLLKMLKRYIGDDSFRAGLKDYFANHAYKNTEAQDLWNALNKSSGKDTASFMTTWISQPGFPVVHAAFKDNQLVLSQKRIFGDDSPSPALWPITLNSNCDSLPQLFNTQAMTIDTDCQTGVRFNTGNDAHFVTHYSNPLMTDIIDQLQSGNLTPIDRLQILNEQIILSQASIISSSELVDLVKSYKDETIESVWDIIGLAIGELKKFVDDDELSESKLRILSRNLAQKQFDRLGWEQKPNEPDTDTKLRSTIIGMMIYGEDKSVIDMAINDYKTLGINNLSPELRSIVLSTMVRHGNDDVVIDKLITLYKISDSAELKEDICDGLTATKDTAVASELLQMAKDTSIIRIQDTLMWIIFLVRNKHTRTLTWQWIRDNWQWIEDTFGDDKGYADYPKYIATALSNRTQLDEYTRFFNPLIEMPALTRSIKVGTKEITERIELLERDTESVRQALVNL